MTMTDDDQAAASLARYIADQVRTATPVQRLLMLFDQLNRDLRGAELAFGTGNLKDISDNLVHAQQVLFALRDPLDVDTDLGRSLSGIYGFCLDQLLRANLRKDRTMLAAVQTVLDRVTAANRAAAAAMAAESAALASPEPVHA